MEYAAKQFKLHILHKSKPMQPFKVELVFPTKHAILKIIIKISMT